MPEQAINTAIEEPVVNVPTEGDNVDVEVKQDEKPQVEIQEPQAKEEELDDYSDKVKSRIAKLTGKLRETERREEASFKYAKRVAEENKKLKAEKNSLDNSYIDEFKARTEIETAKVKFPAGAITLYSPFSSVVALPNPTRFLFAQAVMTTLLLDSIFRNKDLLLFLAQKVFLFNNLFSFFIPC
mgnify:CR=1 FL=1